MMMAGFLCLLVLSFYVLSSPVKSSSSERRGILYPRESESREVKSLDGIWNFRLAPRLNPDLGFDELWFKHGLDQTGTVELMPVPSSYNDITTCKWVRDHVGWAWYDRTFFLPQAWKSNRRIFLRFGAAHYYTIVYVNGQKVVEHAGGALPFLAELKLSNLDFKGENRITVAINNTLSSTTVPQGALRWEDNYWYPDNYFTLSYDFDFFNYAGIHRSVVLYTTPKTFIDDIDVTPRIDGTIGYVKYSVKVFDEDSANNDLESPLIKSTSHTTKVHLEDKEGNKVAFGDGDEGDLPVMNAKLWWPFTMVDKDFRAGYLYTLVVTVTDSLSQTDVYRLKVGIRTVEWTRDRFYINGKPFYFRGFGRHEDSNIRGKGLDNAVLIKDHNLIKWTGANSYRTSHYPYSEELMDVADRLGIVIIDETPAVSIRVFGQEMLENHKEMIREMIQRDKNRPSVVMWSVANEPTTDTYESQGYFREIIDYTRTLDSRRRPVTLVTNRDIDDRTMRLVDIISLNRYYSWYSDTGHTETIQRMMAKDVQRIAEYFGKPVMIAEYGADTVAGLHRIPEFVFTEEYQMTFLKEHFKAFDYLRKNSSLIGEHIWNFADFMTNQGITRIVGNRKGIFTREREPKAAAHLVRHRYHLLAAETDNYPMPDDLKETLPVYKSLDIQPPPHLYEA